MALCFRERRSALTHYLHAGSPLRNSSHSRSTSGITPARTDRGSMWYFDDRHRGNGAATKTQMTTRVPGSVVIMEFSTYTKKMRMRAIVQWSPRAGDQEADELANGPCTAFNPSRSTRGLSRLFVVRSLAGSSGLMGASPKPRT